MKTVLIVSFNFPPLANVTIIRALKFCKFLPQFQWFPWVLTVDKRYYGEKTSDQFNSELNQLEIHRLPYFPVPAARTFIALLFPFLVFFFILKNRKFIDAIYMVGSPFHPFIICPLIKAILHISVILDFKDSWSMNYGFDGTERKSVGKLIRMQHFCYFIIERIALKYASLAIFVTSVLKEEYSITHPHYSYKYRLIYNGFDEDDFVDIKPLKVTDKKTIIIAGQFGVYLGSEAIKILSAIRQVENLSLIYVGSEHKTVENIATDLNMLDRVIIMPYKPYSHVLQLIAGADCCLLSTGLRNGLGTKIFDYMALNKPCLCFVPDESIIKQLFGCLSGIKIVPRPYTEENIKECLHSLLVLKNISLHEHAKKFTRRAATKRLSQLLDEITSC